jgi:hypothetical protein
MTQTARILPETLDGQSLRYWLKEAARFDNLAARASFGWLARGYARRADRARNMAERCRAKEIARGYDFRRDPGR